ncbi:MAG TPA: hypothetical protein DHV48_11985 [Prolixibacteraceae bacterium]|nr:hypothetical protein [Prolixibacteraceae bacterium]
MKELSKTFITIVILVVFLIVSGFAEAADITSTAQGGKWSDKTTWIGGVVPTLTDNVIITSTVTANGGSYSSTPYPVVNLTINAGGKIIREKNSGGLSYLKISGNLTNNGEIIDYADYFDIDLAGNLINNGILKPRYINLIGENQQLSGTSAIECKQINLNMKDEFARAASNLIFKNCRVNSGVSTTNKKLNMNKFSLSLMADSIRYDAYYGSVSSSSEIVIPIVFDGTGILNAENSLIGGTIYGSAIIKSPSYAFFKDLTIEGNLTLDEGAKFSSQVNLQKLRVKGDFTNFADLNKDTVRVRNVKFAPRSMYLYVYGNSNNLGSTGISTVYPTTNGKTISLSGNYDAAVYIQHAENSDKPGGKVLINSEVNISGKLDVYANLEIQPGGTMNMLNKTLTSPVYVRKEQAAITNNGTINRHHRIGNSWSYRSFTAQDGMFADYELREWSDRIEGVDISVFNNQTYSGLPGSVKRWWRLSPVGTGKVKTYTLKLYYDESMLNGQKEKNLKVFRSGDKGTTWELVSIGTNATLDTLENSISIGKWNIATSMLSEFGDFVISSGDGSVPIPSPIILNLVGSTNVRLGAPNRYTIHLYNAGNTRTESFMTSLTVSDDIAFKQVEIPTNDGKIILPIDSIGSPKDHTQVFYIPYLDPNEDYAFDVIVQGVNPGTKSAKNGGTSLTLFGFFDALRSGKKEETYVDVVNKVVDLNPSEMDEYYRALGVTDYKLLTKKEKDGTGAFVVKTFIKHTVETASNANPLTKIAYKIGSAIELVGEVKDSFRRRMWHWLYKEVGLYGVEESSGKTINGKIVTSWDPNEKQGPTGYGESNFLFQANKMNYTILFENKKEATAPAYRVQIVDTLSAVFNPETVKFGTTSHSGPNYNWKMERNGNVLKWDIEGIELPPNITPPEGEGYVTFSVDLKEGLNSGTTIDNKATIVFDINPPITTNVWRNVLDTIAPQTVMTPLKYAVGDTAINVSCNSSDNVNGSGVSKYKYFASVNNEPFKFIGESYENSISFCVSDSTKNNYRFYALATDNVNNAELKVPKYAEINSIPVSNKTNELFSDQLKLYPNPTSGKITVECFTEKRTPVDFEIYSASGELVRISKLGLLEAGKGHFTMDISDLKQGVYFAKVILNQTTETFKVVKN